MEKGELHAVSRNVNQCSSYRKQYRGSSKSCYDPAVPLLGICPKIMKSVCQRNTCTPMFIIALFTIVKSWKQPKCLSTDKWKKKIWYIDTMGYYSP